MTRPDPAEIVEGDSPVVLGIPHAGTWLPDKVRAALNDTGRALADTDWHMDRLYAGLLPGATVVKATAHRYALDANRDPSGESLYPGQNTTGLVPLTDFDGRPIWTRPPDAAEIARRRMQFHLPYHMALSLQIQRVKQRHGVAILWDCHSIRSRIPYLFDGVLPDLNIGTNGGASCAPGIEAAVAEACAASGFTHVLNGRFKGGWTTRHYGAPFQRVHAVQMEIAQSAYLADEAPPWTFDAAKADRLRPVLGGILKTLEQMALSGDLR